MLRLIFCILSFVVYSSSFTQLKYKLVYSDSTSPIIRISISISVPLKTPVSFIMPRSVPGAYSITTYDRFIGNLHAITTTGEKILMKKNADDAPRWIANDSGKQISSIEYQVNVDDMERNLAASDASIIRRGFAGILNYSLFGWIEGTENQPLQLTVETFSSWPIFSTNQPTATPAKGSLTMLVENYYTLADGQVFLGPQFRVKEFKALVPLLIVTYCETSELFLDDYGQQGIISMGILNNYFGEIPFSNYSILIRQAVPLKGKEGPSLGMEHLKSSTFFGDTSNARTTAMDKDQLIRTIPTYLHHMSHAYIPLRCYGDSYSPHVLEIPPIINNIWFNEGFMWFLPYDTLKLERFKNIFETRVYQTSTSIKQMSLFQLSQLASLMYGTDFRIGSGIYSRGALMAIEMNNYIKEKTGGKKSMKDVFKFLYNWSKQNRRPFSLEEFPQLIDEACGLQLDDIYKKWQSPIK
jgi:predicted metalloprotease with PDZ domain